MLDRFACEVWSSSPGRRHASLFQAARRCDGCSVRAICGSAGSDDVCGHSSEYRFGGLVVDDFPNLTLHDLQLPSGVNWPAPPRLGPAIVIGTSRQSPGCDAVRLRTALASHTGRHLGGRVAVLHGSDPELLRLGRMEGVIGARLCAAGASAVIGPGFSTWWNWSPFESLVAMTRSAWFAAAVARHLPAVPTVVWRTTRDLKRWAGWITNENLAVVAVHLGWARGDGVWRWAVSGIADLSRFLGEAGGRVHLLVNGPSTVARMEAVRAAWPGGLTFASQQPWHLAQAGKGLDEDLNPIPKDPTPRRTLEIRNHIMFSRVAGAIVDDHTATSTATPPGQALPSAVGAHRNVSLRAQG